MDQQPVEAARDQPSHEGDTGPDFEDTSSFADSDSGYWGAEPSTRSVASSIYNYEQSHGRTYHSYHSGKYQLPNDIDEQSRIEVKYHAIRLALHDTLYFAPIPDPRAILDIGCGTGVWCVDVADAHPGSLVIGTDLSPIQPTYVPPNLQFEIADADEDWTFSQNFDLIHCRIMNDFTLKSWPHYFEQAFDHLTPGGWIECQEFDYHRRTDDNTIPQDSRLRFWEEEWTRGVQKVGLRGACDPELVMAQMREVGLVNVHTRHFKMPIGPWPKDPKLREAGLFGMVNLLEGLHGLSVKIFTDLLGYSTTELEMLLLECRQECRNRRVHSYYPVYVILGQKPDVQFHG